MKNVSLTREGFVQAAKKYADFSQSTDDTPRNDKDGDVGAASYAHGWQWRQGVNPPHTEHLHRSVANVTPRVSRPDEFDEDWAENEDALFEEGARSSGPSGQGEQHAAAINVHHTIAYSATWRVPILYVQGYWNDGSPLTTEELCQSSAFRITSEDAIPVDDGDRDGAVFPTVSLGENPATGLASVYLHPCQTSTSMAMIMQGEGQDDVVAVEYIRAFVMLCNTVVDMTLR